VGRKQGQGVHRVQTGALAAAGLMAAGLVGLGAAAATPTVAGATSSARSASTAKIYACYTDKTDELFYLDPAKHKACASGETLISWNTSGPQGSTGAPGAPGAQGAAGSPGSAGPRGRAGATGPQGATGPAGVRGVQGAAGSQGQAGATGAAGVPGVRGATGPQGSKGATGGTGAQGAMGARGATGAPGPQGGPGAQGATGRTGNFGHTWVFEQSAKMPAGSLNAYPRLTKEAVGVVTPASGTYAVTATVMGRVDTSSALSTPAHMHCVAGGRVISASSLLSPTPIADMTGSRNGVEFGNATMRGVIPVSSIDPTIEVVCSGSAGGSVGEGSWSTYDVAVTATAIQSKTVDGVRAGHAGAIRQAVPLRNLFPHPARTGRHPDGGVSKGSR
jgi:hypothetical protein